MNKTVKKAMKLMEDVYKGYIPDLEVGEVVELNDVWDGNGECPLEMGSYSYQIADAAWINYVFEVVEEKERQLDTLVRVTKIELL